MASSGFSVKVKINKTSQILKDHGLNEDGRVNRFMRDNADRLMNPFIPMDNGMLRRNKAYPNSLCLQKVVLAGLKKEKRNLRLGRNSNIILLEQVQNGIS